MSNLSSGIGNDFKRTEDRNAENKGRSDRENHNRQDKGGDGHDVKRIPNVAPGESAQDGPMGGGLMNFTQMLENLSAVADNLNYASANPAEDLMDSPIEDTPAVGMGGGNNDELLEALNQIFTPILVMQGLEAATKDQILEAFTESSILTERNIIRFDDNSRMAQLTATCALLLARQADTPQWKMYKEASKIRNTSKLEIQKAYHEAAQALAQQYLVKVSTTNNSSTARQAAQDLLPATQH